MSSSPDRTCFRLVIVILRISVVLGPAFDTKRYDHFKMCTTVIQFLLNVLRKALALMNYCLFLVGVQCTSTSISSLIKLLEPRLAYIIIYLPSLCMYSYIIIMLYKSLLLCLLSLSTLCSRCFLLVVSIGVLLDSTILLNVVGQITQCSVPKEQINLLKRHPLGLLKEDDKAWESDNQVEGDKEEVELPAEMAQRNRTDLSPEGCN